MGTVQDGHVNEVENEYLDVSGGRNENDRRRRTHSVATISHTRRGLAASRAGAVQLHDYPPARRPEWIASGQYPWTFEYPISYGRPPESQGTDATARKGKFQADSKPNNKHHKMYRQFAKPPGQTPGEYSRDYPRATTVDGDDRRYGELKAPVGDGLFAAYDPLDMKAAKYLIVASFGCSLFWPDAIFLTAPKLDWGQSIGMMISVRRVVSMEPQVIVVAWSNDHLQSRGLFSRLTDGSIPSNEVIGEAIMTLLSAMAEVETAAKQRFTQNVVEVVFVLSPGYAALPEPLQFVYTMVTTIAEGRFNVIIPAPNRMVDPNNYYPSRSELPAVDISNDIQGLKDCSTTRLVLDEVLGLELSNFARLLKLRPGVDDNHLLVQQVADDLWFRQMDYAENEQGRTVRKNMTSAEEDLMAMALRTKPHNN